MSYDPFNNLLLLAGVYSVDVRSPVELSLTATNAFTAVEHFVNISRFVATLVLVLAGTETRAGLHFGWFWVETAVTHFCDRIVLLTTVTADQVQVGPHLPVNLLPADSESLSDEGDKLLQVPIPVDHMLGAHLTVGVNRLLSIVAGKDFALLF